ncbi:MAG: methylated-DNA--[protein]-cysteine S-methyltransferase [bacterium]|nr:methylated-DNA--[protein]-cysteine S-methyltransferase [bacterium]
MKYTSYKSPLGELLLAGDAEGLRLVDFRSGTHPVPIRPEWQRDPGFFSETVSQLRAYFAGTREEFDLPLAPHGSAFQRRVWDELQRIPFGTTISYGELAERIRRPKAVRAVGAANGANPIPIVIPCHRVIGANGKLTGYGGGIEIKEKLLAHEGALLAL